MFALSLYCLCICIVFVFVLPLYLYCLCLCIVFVFVLPLYCLFICIVFVFVLSHFVLQPSEELEIKWFEAVAIRGDEVKAAVDAAINLTSSQY